MVGDFRDSEGYSFLVGNRDEIISKQIYFRYQKAFKPPESLYPQTSSVFRIISKDDGARLALGSKEQMLYKMACGQIR